LPAQRRTIAIPIANYDDNQHDANENLRLQNPWNGVETMARLAGVWAAVVTIIFFALNIIF
jgi:hypothetical protein